MCGTRRPVLGSLSIVRIERERHAAVHHPPPQRLAVAGRSRAGRGPLDHASPTSRCPTTSAGSAATCSRRAPARSAPSASTRRRAPRRSASTRSSPACRSTRSSPSPTRSSSAPTRWRGRGVDASPRIRPAVAGPGARSVGGPATSFSCESTHAADRRDPRVDARVTGSRAAVAEARDPDQRLRARRSSPTSGPPLSPEQVSRPGLLAHSMLGAKYVPRARVAAAARARRPDLEDDAAQLARRGRGALPGLAPAGGADGRARARRRGRHRQRPHAVDRLRSRISSAAS